MSETAQSVALGRRPRKRGSLFPPKCWWTLLLAFAGLLALPGCSSPTEPTRTLHPREALLAELVQCYAQALGVVGEVTVRFEDDLGVTDCPADLGSGVTCPAAGRTWPSSGVVTFWGPWARGETEHPAPLGHLALGAAHEACHLSGVGAEDDAQTCSTLLVGSADCLTRYGDDAP